ncbi:MAG TPA: hypothetical protein H9851_03615 [Candidatus Borkfalkia faecavium]|uniref:Uncharacterized protein n=1 Tax=Candidatus Borkfalkia faecavium TaxID=2838508 RepID=A0A9D2AV79_9FIRM|nr:hypothetical protein [Candidatus Borkfalkia faecavium]
MGAGKSSQKVAGQGEREEGWEGKQKKWQQKGRGKTAAPFGVIVSGVRCHLLST